ncbi:MAG: mechanosensitive ion channel family protein [Gammaproteobacteria bacterium]
MTDIVAELPARLENAAILAGAALAGYLAYGVLRWTLRLATTHAADFIVTPLIQRCRAPVSLLLPLVAFYLALPLTGIRTETGWVRHVTQIALIMAVTWLLVRLLRVAEDIIAGRLELQAADNLHARAVQTQFRILRNVLVSLVVVLGITGVLLTIDRFREFGAGLLASAGIASIVVGLAAQRTLGNLFAGFQIAISQPIRFDDVLVVEGQWGRVEEITLTYVVLRCWDLRRLVVPISYFLDKPFENWTRRTANLLGPVLLYVDYTVDVVAVREELKRIAAASDLWDGDVCALEVTDADSQSVQLRALVSARNSSQVWDLRCEVREKLIAFIQREYPDALPRTRTTLEREREENS